LSFWFLAFGFYEKWGFGLFFAVSIQHFYHFLLSTSSNIEQAWISNA